MRKGRLSQALKQIDIGPIRLPKDCGGSPTIQHEIEARTQAQLFI